MTASDGLTAVGLMSGTSCDGIDAAVVRTDGERVAWRGPSLTVPYDDEFRARLREVAGGRGESGAVAREVSDRHAEAVARVLAVAALRPADVDLIGFHGHTVEHRPEQGRTRQIGDAGRLAAATGIDVVADFRSADVAAGGEGAPLVPLYHRALAHGLTRPLAVLNLGGVANVTWIAEDGTLLAFDTGPGNALLDDWARERAGRPMDEGGALAAAGSVDAGALEALLAHPYFGRPPPKSLDRDEFAAHAGARLRGLSAGDGAATLAAFTARAVAAAVRWFPAPPGRWLVAGGGRRNPVLMAALAAALAAPVAAVEAEGWDGDSMEAEAFAFLAVRSLRGLPLSLPGTTGVPAPMPGGRLHRAPRAGASR